MSENRRNHGLATKPRTWTGPKPEKCELCQQPLTGNFVDGATRAGFWAIMCDFCHFRSGRGLGIGRGQRYSLDTLEKVAG